jgi:hypothetical protein
MMMRSSVGTAACVCFKTKGMAGKKSSLRSMPQTRRRSRLGTESRTSAQQISRLVEFFPMPAKKDLHPEL